MEAKGPHGLAVLTADDIQDVGHGAGKMSSISYHASAGSCLHSDYAITRMMANSRYRPN